MASNESILAGFFSLGSKVNKLRGKDTSETEQGAVGPKMPELSLDTPNTEIIDITAKWNKKWTESDTYQKWTDAGKENENYWLGKQYTRAEIEKARAMVDNAIFEALETYLPQVTRRNPEPMVTLKSREAQKDPAHQEWVTKLQEKLGDIADETVMRLKLKKMARHWAIYLLGMIKMGWDLDNDRPSIKVVRGKKLIMDPDAVTDEDGYNGKYIGEHRKMEASKLLAILEKNGEEEGTKKIKELVDKDSGTDIGFIEWWTEEYTCWTMDETVLMKKKNLHFNYETTIPGEPIIDPMTQQPMIGENGQPMLGEPTTTPGYNHFKTPGIPYIPLVVFNLGMKPVDDTSLIGQNLANQDVINKRNKQIDKNADSMNGAIAISLERAGLTKDEASQVTKAIQKGGVVAIPSGDVQSAVMRLASPGLPADIFNNLYDMRNRVKDIFGTRGSSAAGLESETTVRGKIMNRTLDSDRIGGGFSEYLEQVSDKVYNWCVQLLYVYDDEFANGEPKPEIRVSVKEGSLLPKDSTTIANQAIELAGAGKMSIIDLYKRLDYPNPEELGANVWLEANAPELLFANDERVQQAIQMKQQAAQQANAVEPKEPSMSISFKDLPPEGQAQMAAKAGINLEPEAIAAYDENERNKTKEDKTPLQEKIALPAVAT